MNQYILTIDIGTTSTKAFAFIPKGLALGKYQQPYPTSYPQPNFAEQSPDEILSAVKNSIKYLVDKIGYQPLAIAFSSAMHSIMAIDRNGNALTQLIIWADNRSELQAEEIKNSDLGKEIYEQGGTPIHPMSPLCKLRWLKEKQPEIVERADKFISIKEYVCFKLTGEYVIDYSIASATGLLDTKNLIWNSNALRYCGISSHQLSTLCDTEHKLNLQPSVATELGLSIDIPIIVGASDGCLANLGSNTLNIGDMAITIGTSGAVRMASSQFTVDPLQRTFCYYLSKEKFIVGGASNNGAVLLNWFNNSLLMNTQSAEDFINDCFSVPSSEGLIFLPYVMGERAPLYDANARGAYIGLTIKHNQAHLKRALIEGICFAIKSIVMSVEEVVTSANRISVSGGFIQSQAWVQLLSDVLGRPLEIDGNEDASSVGAALLGFKALGIEALFTSQSQKVFYPNMNNHDCFNKEFIIFQSLYFSLRDEFKKIKRLQQ